MSGSFVLGHPPQTREELWWAVRALFGVTIPRTRVCPDHVAPFDAFADAYFGECTIYPERGPFISSRAIWHASRGLAGKSKTLSVLGQTFAFFKGADITILGGSMAQSINVHEYMTALLNHDHVPQDMIVDRTATKIILANRGRVRPLPASQRNVRGPHPSVLLIDEVDEVELEIYDAALGQPMPQPNYLGQIVPTMTVISSTWQNADGTLTEIFRRAEELDPPDPIYRWCYKENLDANNPSCPDTGRSEGWLTQATIDEKKRSVSAEMFRIEYDLGEPSIGNRAIDTDKVDEVFCLDVQPIETKEAKDFWEYRFEEPQPNAVYVASADWAKEKDYTVILITRVDGLKRRLAYYLRVNRRNYPTMIGYFNRAVQQYRVSRNGAWHDSTGLGNVVNDYLDMRARPFPMTGDKRAKLLSDYVNAIEKVTWELPKMLKAMYLEHKYCRTGDLYSNAQEYHLPDTLCSAALAEYAATKVRAIAAPEVVPRDDTPSKFAAQFSNSTDEDKYRSRLENEIAETEMSLLV